MSDSIFNFSYDNGWSYKGVLSAEMDKKAVDDFAGGPPLMQTFDRKYVVEILGFIWTDEHGEWNMRMRLKFPSGNKQAYGSHYGKNVNETFVLQDMYRLPMINKNWFSNKEGTLDSLIKLMKQKDLIESIQIITEV